MAAQVSECKLRILCTCCTHTHAYYVHHVASYAHIQKLYFYTDQSLSLPCSGDGKVDSLAKENSDQSVPKSIYICGSIATINSKYSACSVKVLRVLRFHPNVRKAFAVFVSFVLKVLRKTIAQNI